MADPDLPYTPPPPRPGLLLATVTFQDQTGLSKDRFVNTFHFNVPVPFTTPDAGVAANIVNQLTRFYNLTVSGGLAMHDFLAGSINRTTLIKIYDLSRSPAGAPFHTDGFELGTAPGAADIPPQVSLCLSYTADINAKRHRGRIYLGPFCTNVLSTTAGLESRPTTYLTTTALGAGARMIADGLAVTGGDRAYWCVLSNKDNLWRNVEHVSIDDSWDIQRRRREAPTFRHVLP